MEAETKITSMCSLDDMMRTNKCDGIDTFEPTTNLPKKNQALFIEQSKTLLEMSLDDQ